MDDDTRIWHVARNLYIGDYRFGVRRIDLAVKLLETTKHPEAQWLLDMHKIVDPRRFSHLYDADSTDARALFFAIYCDSRLDRSAEVALQIAAHMGYPIAQARYSSSAYCRAHEGRDMQRVYAKRAADANEPEGFLELSKLVDSMDEKVALVKRASDMGSLRASRHLFELLNTDTTNPLRYTCAFTLGSNYWTYGSADVLSKMVRAVRQFLVRHKQKYGRAVYAIGKCVANCKIGSDRFGFFIDMDKLRPRQISDAENRALVAAWDHYEVSRDNARSAVDMWSMCARRMGVVKDIRVLIGKMLWDHRLEFASYREQDYDKMHVSSDGECETKATRSARKKLKR